MHTHEGSFCPYLKCHTQGKPPHVECILEKVKWIIHLPYDKQHQLCFLFGFCRSPCAHIFHVLVFLSISSPSCFWWLAASTVPYPHPCWFWSKMNLYPIGSFLLPGEGLEIGLSSDWIVSPEARVQERSKRRHVIFWLGHTGVLH